MSFALPAPNQHHRAGDLVDPLCGLRAETAEGRGDMCPDVTYDCAAVRSIDGAMLVEAPFCALPSSAFTGLSAVAGAITGGLQIRRRCAGSPRGACPRTSS